MSGTVLISIRDERIRPINHPSSSYLQKTVEWVQDNGNFILEKTKEIALGIFTWCAEFYLLLKASPLIEALLLKLKKFGIDVFEKGQDIVEILDSVRNGQKSIIKSLGKVALISYITIFGPILEEHLFRNKIYNWIKGKQNDPNSLLSKISRIFFNAALFGLAHFSPYQGWANVPIILMTFTGGLFLTSLREFTGNIVASSTSHMINNIFTTYCLLKGINI